MGGNSGGVRIIPVEQWCENTDRVNSWAEGLEGLGEPFRDAAPPLRIHRRCGRLVRFSRRLYTALEAGADSGDLDTAALAAFASIGLAAQDARNAERLPAPQQALLATLRSGVGTVNAPVGFPLSAAHFRAASFYTRSGALADYYVARQWYATVLFRLSDLRETRLAVALAARMEQNPELRTLWQQLMSPFDRLLAPSEDGDCRVYLAAAREVLGDGLDSERIAAQIAGIQKALEARLPEVRVNDQLLAPEAYARFGRGIKGFRLLPPQPLPCAVTFHETTDPRIPGRAMPSGLDFLVACPTLRSTAAMRALELAEGPAVLQAVQACRSASLPESLHGDAMRLLSLLQKPLSPSAPPPGAITSSGRSLVPGPNNATPGRSTPKSRSIT